jgi:hypothetical protein
VSTFGAGDPGFQSPEQEVAVAGAPANAIPVQQAEEGGAVADLVVGALLGVRGRPFERSVELILGDGFDVVASGESASPEALAVVVGESVGIRDQPSLDSTDHEVAALLWKMRCRPAISLAEVLPAGQRDLLFRIDEHDVECVGVVP